MRLFIAALFTCGFGWAQLQCNQMPNGTPCQTINNYTGSNLTSSCTALSVETLRRPTISVAITAATNANPVVFTSTGHGFALGSRPFVTITGFTAGWVTANISGTATVIDANTFSMVFDSSALGAIAGSPVFSTTAPRTTVAEWSIRVFKYDGSNNLIGAFWLNGAMNVGTGNGSLCTSTALSTAQAQ
jgi:hypothetical protein